MVFHWSLSDKKSPQNSRTLLSILAVLSKAVICIVSTRPPTSKSSRSFNNPSFVVVPKAPVTIGTIILLFTFFQFFCGQLGQQNRQFCKFSFFFFVNYSGLLAEIRWSVCKSKSHRSLCVSFSRTRLCIYHLLVWSNLNFLHISSRSLCPPSRVSSYTPSMLICCIRL